MRGQLLFQRNACGTCHGVGGVNGTAAAPGLADTASLLPPTTLESLLRHYSVRMRDGGMPNINFNAEEIQAIVAYIRAMRPNSDGHELVASGIGSKVK